MEFLQTVSGHNNTPLPTPQNRKDVIENQIWCRSTNIYILNSKGEILCHRRSDLKERFAGFWCTHVGGHVSFGESYEENAFKEIEEETGVIIPSNHLLPWRITKLPASRLWVKEFLAIVDKPISEFVPQPGEVEEFAWKSIEQIILETRTQQIDWLAGTHDIMADYQCLRAVMTTAGSFGLLQIAPDLHTWHPPYHEAVIQKGT